MNRITGAIIGLFIIFCVGIGVSYFYVPEKTVIYNKEYSVNAEELDFTEKEIGNFSELVDKIHYFDKLKTVKFKNGTVSLYQKNTLQKLYPKVEFKTISYIDVYGESYREDVSEIDLSNAVIDNTLNEKLNDFYDLKTVNLYNQNLSLEEKIALKESHPNVAFMWKVNINGTDYEYNTESLDLTGIQISDKALFTKTINLFSNLKSLDMSNSNFTNEELGALRESYPNTEINWIVHIGRWHIKTSDTSFSVLIRAFDYEYLTSDDLEVLKYCTKLEALDLGHQHITDISKIPEYCPNLKILILADNRITDITPISKLKDLVYLELFINKITDLSPLKECKKLVDLNLCYNNQLTDITPLFELPKLERVWLVNVKAPREDVDKLQETHPNATIVTLGPGSTESGWRTHERYFAMIKMYRNPTWPVADVFKKYYEE